MAIIPQGLRRIDIAAGCTEATASRVPAGRVSSLFESRLNAAGLRCAAHPVTQNVDTAGPGHEIRTRVYVTVSSAIQTSLVDALWWDSMRDAGAPDVDARELTEAMPESLSGQSRDVAFWHLARTWRPLRREVSAATLADVTRLPNPDGSVFDGQIHDSSVPAQVGADTDSAINRARDSAASLGDQISGAIRSTLSLSLPAKIAVGVVVVGVGAVAVGYTVRSFK